MALGVGQRAPDALRAARRHRLAPRARGLGQVAGELRAARVALEQRDALALAPAVGPQLQRAPRGTRLVAIGVHGRELGQRPQQRVERPRAVVGGQPVRGDLDSRPAAGLQRLGQAPVQRPAPRPGDVLVDGVAGERVAEGAGARLGLGHQPAGQQLGEPGVAAEGRHQLEVEARPRHRCGLGRGARLVREPGRAQEHRVADRLGHRDLAVARELEAALALGQPGAGLQRARQLLDEEGHALGAVVQRARQRRRRRRAEDLGGELRGAVGAERLEHELAQGPRAAQLVAQAA